MTATDVSEAAASAAIPASTNVFCNRALNLGGIQAVGFDMDYTLAEYVPETFDLLAYDGAIEKLVNTMGYPAAVLDLVYDPHAYMRGLVIDKKRGNLLKLDRHKYVKVAYHGLKRMTPEERKAIYATSFETAPAFTPPDFSTIDTAFLLVDACLFCQLVSYKDDHPDEVTKSYEQIYRDVRRAVDLCHCDGVIKDAVAVNPAKYIRSDPALATMLTALKQGGKQVFIVTNSLYDYTDVVLRHLLGASWLDYFDLVVCGARKPGFLLDPYLPIFQVRQDGSLENAEIISPQDGARLLQRSRVFQGGNWQHLHALLQLASGSGLLYVGDHMYSDILRSKRTLGWRTLLIVPELRDELLTAEETRHLAAAVDEAYAERAAVEARLQHLEIRRSQLEIDSEVEALLEGDGGAAKAEALSEEERAELLERLGPPHALAELDERIAEARDQQRVLSSALNEALCRQHEAYHPAWGRLFKTGAQNSRWAQQVQEYACLYTSHVTNLVQFAPDTSFRALSDLMPHDRAPPA
ncbi:hypothetical protein EMIHUDRAFT_452284 [Emiliania huxleyi CCMP1516]|uniref:5'-nucleotidase n=2 Tax=Emiliania huxleyi TaxID=2903 RepID=A0A0D3ILR5_EMIH1|nr:hypothetical protein EMIHUDRAFT_452284 [Emiliania huxleyi CCMP1516]EOD12200.1 hypothetical protein EMIHUDRAFT_452284 [Emiliania huxleyi CCMP1516]|eukprot:XP_005764629.1 hypothetical protein EMIHUDRAFT_452284 [Emiliania huxleyi CCMP1516]